MLLKMTMFLSNLTAALAIEVGINVSKKYMITSIPQEECGKTLC